MRAQYPCTGSRGADSVGGGCEGGALVDGSRDQRREEGRDAGRREPHRDRVDGFWAAGGVVPCVTVDLEVDESRCDQLSRVGDYLLVRTLRRSPVSPPGDHAALDEKRAFTAGQATNPATKKRSHLAQRPSRSENQRLFVLICMGSSARVSDRI